MKLHNQASTKKTVNDLDLFYLILEAYGWESPSKREEDSYLESYNRPEAILLYSTREAILEACFHQPLNMISVKIRDIYKKNHILFHFMYDDKPERILEWLAAQSDNLSFETYPKLLKKAAGKCEMILLELADNQMYEVIPPKA